MEDETMNKEAPPKRRFQPIRLNYDEMMAEFKACAIKTTRPKTLAAPERKERKKLERFVFNPSDFEDSPPKRAKMRSVKQSLPSQVRSSEAVNFKRKTNWNLNDGKPKRVTDVLKQAKVEKKSFLNNPIETYGIKNKFGINSKNQNKRGSINKQSVHKAKLKNKSSLRKESKKLDFSINTPEWNVDQLCLNKKAPLTPTSELSPNECEFLEIEKRLAEKVSTGTSSWEIEIHSILEEDRREVYKFQNKVKKLVDEFITAQDQRNDKIMQIINTVKKSSKSNLCCTPLRDITSTMNNSKLVSHSDEKTLTRSKEVPEDKVMDKALNLYNSMRTISKSFLATPKLNRSSLQTPKSIKKSGGVSISKIIQKQCLMLHETPFKN